MMDLTRETTFMMGSDKILTLAVPTPTLLEQYLNLIEELRFYTNVQMVGDNFLVRGYEDGKHFATREKFYPTLFVNSKRKSKYKTLTGDVVEPIKPGTVRDCREFIKKVCGDRKL